MLAAIGARLAASVLMQSPIGGFIRGAGRLLRKVPWQVWAALALALAVFIGVKIHNHKVSAFGTERFNSGFTAGYAKAKADAAKAVHEVETKGRTMAHEVRSKNDAKTADLLSALLALCSCGAQGVLPAVPSLPPPPTARPDPAEQKEMTPYLAACRRRAAAHRTAGRCSRRFRPAKRQSPRRQRQLVGVV
jgi:hypothetical protein